MQQSSEAINVGCTCLCEHVDGRLARNHDSKRELDRRAKYIMAIVDISTFPSFLSVPSNVCSCISEKANDMHQQRMSHELFIGVLFTGASSPKNKNK